jgi:hypothetical protein
MFYEQSVFLLNNHFCAAFHARSLLYIVLFNIVYIYNWIIPKDGNMFPGWLRMIFASWLQVCNFYFMCFVFGSWSFRSRIWSVDDYGDDDDDDVVAMWQCGTQNEGPRKKSLQLSTAEHWEPVGFQEKRAARNSGIGGCGQQGLCDLLANARSARRLILFFDGCGIVQVDLAMGSMIVLRSVGEKTGHLYHLCSSCSQIWCIALNCYNLMCYSA